MLEKLQIRNYAIIEELDIRFTDGLNIITGETGAGKSILMGALNLVLGERADTQVLLHPDKKCIVEACFQIRSQERVNAFLHDNNLDEEEGIRVRREISPQGKSRSFINDTPVNLSQLKSLSFLLVDLHQQFDTLELGSADFQREALDAWAGNLPDLSKMKDAFAQYQHISQQLDQLKQEQSRANQELDYNRFLFDELDALALKPGETEELEAESRLLEHAGTVGAQLNSACHILTGSDQPMVQQLKAILNRLKTIQEFHPDLEAIALRLQSTQVELTDIADELQRVNEHINLDPARKEWLQDRLSAIYTLLRKHAVQSSADLLGIMDKLQHKLDAVTNLSAEIITLEKKLGDSTMVCMGIAGRLSKARKKSKDQLAESVNQLLVQVGMPNARMVIELKEAGLSAFGTDEVNFLFDANKTGRFEKLHKVASGGELSRLMLSIKSLVAGKLLLPTLIFDEIDTGISGEAAKQVGIIMKELSGVHQIIAITHQPQIAARARSHFYVYKQDKDNKLVTSIRLLDINERISTIARMMSGEKPSAAAMENAKELVES